MESMVGSIGSAAQSLLDPLRGLAAGPILGALVILLGLAVSLKGYTWRRAFLTIGGLLAGGLAGLSVAAVAQADREGLILACVAGAVAGGLLAYFLYFLALALFGASAGASLGYLALSTGLDATASVIIGGVGAVAGAIVAIKGQQVIFIVVSAVVGGIVAGIGTALIPAIPLAAVVVPCVLGGLAFQIYERERNRKNQPAKAAAKSTATPKPQSAGRGQVTTDADGNRCPSCGYPNSGAATSCGLCSAPLGTSRSDR